MASLPRRPLGGSGMAVSVLALGSWRTFERIPREAGVAVMEAARAAGITFLDDARYDDETGTAPMRTGWSEVVFGELFRAAGWRRDEVVVANKLWWEFWPDETAAAELDGSLGRMGLSHLDVLYSAPPPEALAVDELVGSMADLVASGKVRAWGVLNWPAGLVAAATATATGQGLPAPCAAQLPYNLVHRNVVEDAALGDSLDAAGASVVASAVLAGGALTGKYRGGATGGRLTGRLDRPHHQPALAAVPELAGVADELATTPAALAVAFALAGPRVASVLFGATAARQVWDNVAAVDLLDRLSQADVDRLRAMG